MKTQSSIKFLRTLSNMTQKSLADKLGVSVMTIRSWESGAKAPSAGAIISLAELFNVSSDYILGISNGSAISTSEMDLIFKYRKLDGYTRGIVDTILQYASDNSGYSVRHEAEAVRYIPRYINPAAAGYSAPLDGEDFEMLRVDDTVPSNADFAVRIQGNSMAPYIHDGDTVYVKKTSEISGGEIGIFNVDGSTYCKLFNSTDDVITLVSTNPEFAKSNIRISPDANSSAVCFGKVIGFENIPVPEYFKI